MSSRRWWISLGLCRNLVWYAINQSCWLSELVRFKLGLASSKYNSIVKHRQGISSWRSLNNVPSVLETPSSAGSFPSASAAGGKVSEWTDCTLSARVLLCWRGHLRYLRLRLRASAIDAPRDQLCQQHHLVRGKCCSEKADQSRLLQGITEMLKLKLRLNKERQLLEQLGKKELILTIQFANSGIHSIQTRLADATEVAMRDRVQHEQVVSAFVSQKLISSYS